jgi:hypothetical protein
MNQAAPSIGKAQDNSLAKRIVAHWLEELEKTPTSDEPCQHLYCDRMWPEDVYDDILRLLPKQDSYQPQNLKVWVNAQGVSTRDRCLLPEAIEGMDEERARFWHQIWLALTAESFKRMLFAKFAKDIALRLDKKPEHVVDTEVFANCTLLHDIEDYKIKPHPDGWPSIVTIQFYLPADMSQQDLGTSFYAETPLWRRPFEGRYREIKRMPFKPNSGYAFVVNDLPGRRSLHGRELIQPGAGARNTMLIRLAAEDHNRKRGQKGFSQTHTLF